MPCFDFCQRAMTAFRASSERASGLNRAIRAGPPFKPPSRPRATAARFLIFFFLVVCFALLAMSLDLIVPFGRIIHNPHAGLLMPCAEHNLYLTVAEKTLSLQFKKPWIFLVDFNSSSNPNHARQRESSKKSEWRCLLDKVRTFYAENLVS